MWRHELCAALHVTLTTERLEFELKRAHFARLGGGASIEFESTSLFEELGFTAASLVARRYWNYI